MMKPKYPLSEFRRSQELLNLTEINPIRTPYLKQFKNDERKKKNKNISDCLKHPNQRKIKLLLDIETEKLVSKI